MAMVETTLSISNVMSKFQFAFQAAIVYMSALAFHLLGILATIDLLWSVLSNLDEQDHLKNLILRCMKYGFFLWVVLKYGWLLDCIIDGFYSAGMYAGGDKTAVRGYLSNPDQLIYFGIYVASKSLHYSSQTAAALAQALGASTHSTISWHDIIAFLTVSGYFVMALQVFLTYLEFYILGGLALLIVPFGVFQRTSHLAEKVFAMVICFGVKLMVIAFILSILDPLFRGFVAPGASDPNYIPTIPESIQYVCGSLVICVLMWHAPNMAAGLLAGALSLNAGSSVQQFRGLTYGMGAGMMGTGMMGTGMMGRGGSGGDNVTAVKAASDVARAPAGANPDTGQAASGNGQITSVSTAGRGTTGDGGSIKGGKTIEGGGGNTTITAPEAAKRANYISNRQTSTNEAAATKDNKPS